MVIKETTCGALLITKVKYIRVTQFIWLHQRLFDLKHTQDITININLVFHGRSKYIHIKFHYIHELLKKLKKLCLSFFLLKIKLQTFLHSQSSVETIAQVEKCDGYEI